MSPTLNSFRILGKLWYVQSVSTVLTPAKIAKWCHVEMCPPYF